MRVIAVINTGPASSLPAVIDEAFAAIRGRPEPYLHGHLHALAALAAHRRGALEQAVTHLVLSARSLRRMEAEDTYAVWGWFNLAMAYSYTGFHGHATGAHERALQIGRAGGVPLDPFAAPGVRLRGAVLHDQQGDTESCVRVLRDLMVDHAQHRKLGVVEQVRPAIRASWGYTVVRLGALGEACDVDARPLLHYRGESTRIRDLIALGEVCVEIRDGRPHEALKLLDQVSVSPETLGPAEVPRLRCLAYLRSGDHRRAHAADREAFRLASLRGEQMREVFVEGVAARLEHEDLRRTVARYADEALTDPLTGLPNRRHFEQYIAAMMERSEQAVIGVCDMDGFKAVNTVHGHLAGDVVLQRVGEIIDRVMRRGDFVARYGGDEFVVVLPKTSLREAGEIAHRIVNAVSDADWTTLVPGTPVSVSIGWAEVAGPRMELRRALIEAFEAADRAMLHAKTHARAS
ncbi:MAG TPA: GGDEF domain-containing protein [Micromonosporaceae bacterium]|jgi:diguanylate cyclase (GGDEF)-like protein|nr:GGDEF domain-containing protein [Micromonosporaceae bacterium]